MWEIRFTKNAGKDKERLKRTGLVENQKAIEFHSRQSFSNVSFL